MHLSILLERGKKWKDFLRSLAHIMRLKTTVSRWKPFSGVAQWLASWGLPLDAWINNKRISLIKSNDGWLCGWGTENFLLYPRRLASFGPSHSKQELIYGAGYRSAPRHRETNCSPSISPSYLRKSFLDEEHSSVTRYVLAAARERELLASCWAKCLGWAENFRMIEYYTKFLSRPRRLSWVVEEWNQWYWRLLLF